MAAKPTMLTEEGLRKLEEELEYLHNVKRKEIAEKIKVALKGTYTIESQTVTLGYNAKTREDVVTDVRVEAEREREVAVFYLVDNGRNNIVTADGDRIIFIA